MPFSTLDSLRCQMEKLLDCNGVLEPLYPCPNGADCTIQSQHPSHFTSTVDNFVKTVRHDEHQDPVE
ncbi:Solute carrier family 25 member 39 [Galemys pyrenaicus]|uniref:Solute carrier family 25 member 39 n=1 Tax=Galemys pyrenaicus TaxID=202257 RepID=A0A8J6DNX9_GALPY|nr:Solute carrier family 25 member 39 [Galemys pyrenaicus]